MSMKFVPFDHDHSNGCVVLTVYRTIYVGDRIEGVPRYLDRPRYPLNLDYIDGLKMIKRSELSPHFDQARIFKYKSYTQAFFDIFTLDGDTITLRDKQDSIVEQSTSIVKQNANILDQNLLLLKQNSLLMEQNGLLLQLLAEKKVPEQADLLQL